MTTEALVSAPSSTDLYYWLVAPVAQCGGGRTVYGAALWLSDWDGVTVPEGFGAWATTAARR
jgi:hypothetical protein